MKAYSTLKQAMYYNEDILDAQGWKGRQLHLQDLSCIFPYDFFFNFCYSRLQDMYNATYVDRVPALHVGFQLSHIYCQFFPTEIQRTWRQ